MIRLGFLTGVIPKDKMHSFERVLWRATRGNLYMKSSPIDEPIEDPHTVSTSPLLQSSDCVSLCYLHRELK